LPETATTCCRLLLLLNETYYSDDDDDDDDDESIGYVRPLLQLKTVTSVLSDIIKKRLAKFEAACDDIVS